MSFLNPYFLRVKENSSHTQMGSFKFKFFKHPSHMEVPTPGLKYE